METPLHIAGNRVVGGDLALDFLNTQNGPPDGPPVNDVLHDYDDLVLWARHVGEVDDADAGQLIDRARRAPDQGMAMLERARDVRSNLQALFDAVARDEELPVDGLAQLRRDEATAMEHGRLVPAGDAVTWSWAGTADLGRPLWPVVHAAVQLLTSGSLRRVKACGGCRYLFLDTTKNGSRRWCAMEDCGTAEKSRTFVARRRARRKAGS